MESAKRLIITEMLLENFKSYAGAQKVGPFHKVSPANGKLKLQRACEPLVEGFQNHQDNRLRESRGVMTFISICESTEERGHNV